MHVAPTPFFSDRGCHIRIEGIVKALHKEGVDSIVCTYHHGRERPQIETVRISPIKGYDDTRAGPNSFKYLADLKLLWLVYRRLRTRRPDIIHAHLHEGVLVAWLARWLSLRPGTPVVADIQGSLVGELDSYGYFREAGVKRKLFEWLERVILKMPHHVFCSSVASMAMLQREYGLSRQRLTLLCDRVDAQIVADPAPTHSRTGDVTVIYSGSLLPSKGLPVLLQLVEKLLNRRGDVRIVLVGYPVEEVAAFLQDKGLADRCTLVGRVRFEDLPAYLAQADIGLDPKTHGAGEGSGKILNYMAAGLPVVAFDSDNNRDFLGHREDLVSAGSVDGFVDRIELLIDEPELRRREGERNRQRVRQALTWDAGIELVAHTYDKLLGGRPLTPNKSH